MRLLSSLPLAVVSFSFSTCSASDSSAESCTAEGTCFNPSDALECGVYMAPSTLGNNTNMGFYTGKNLEPNEVINYPEIVIPLLFREWGEHPSFADGDGQLWERYVWEGEVANIEAYSETDREDTKAIFVPGVGCTVNSILDMANVVSTHGSIYDTAGISRKDPAAGAFTPYHSSITKTRDSVEMGSELFASYGETWIPWIPGAQITLDKYLDEADAFLDEYYEWLQATRKEHTVTDDVAEALWKMTAKEFPYFSRAFTVLPRTDWATVEEALKRKQTTASIPREFIRSQGKRSLEWLQTHGKCQDHIKPGNSTIPQAGRGAFAARNLPKGTVVGYAPLVHIGEKALELWNISYPSGALSNQNYTQLDLVINYSFGHKNSTIMLTPYGGMVNYINHDKERANVRVAWPKQDLVAHKPDWLEKDVKFLRNTVNKIGLSFDYVALRDIQDGEEIFMDYGDEWQAAWDKHVKNWKPPSDADTYVHSSNYELDFFRTPSELKKHPYPPNLHTMCVESFRKDTATGTFEFLPVLRKDHKRVYCSVTERHKDANGDYTYTIFMTLANGEKVSVRKVTTQGLFLYDKVYSSDWHLPNAFRHAIAIPDDVFPQSWTN